MTDRLGWRRKFGVIAPSTNTIVEPEFAMLQVPGVTAHFSRIHIRDQDMDSDDAAWSGCSSRSAPRSAARASGC